MILVLCDADDVAALWLVARLRAAGEQCLLVTSDLLSFARMRSQRIGRDGARALVRLDEATVIETPDLVVNRMPAPPTAAWRHAAPAEREYATAELIAFVLSWLAGLQCPVRNRPEPECLAGPAPHDLLAAVQAHRAGLDCADASFGADVSPFPLLESALRAAGPGARPVHAVVLDGRILDPEGLARRAGAPLPARLADAVEGFAAAIGANRALIGIDFVVAGRWWFAGSTPLPDLPTAGDTLVRDLTRLSERVPA
jgi:hypothetical protein